MSLSAVPYTFFAASLASRGEVADPSAAQPVLMSATMPASLGAPMLVPPTATQPPKSES